MSLCPFLPQLARQQLASLSDIMLFITARACDCPGLRRGRKDGSWCVEHGTTIKKNYKAKKGEANTQRTFETETQVHDETANVPTFLYKKMNLLNVQNVHTEKEEGQGGSLKELTETKGTM